MSGVSKEDQYKRAGVELLVKYLEEMGDIISDKSKSWYVKAASISITDAKYASLLAQVRNEIYANE